MLYGQSSPISPRFLSATGRVIRYVQAELSATSRAVHGPSCPGIIDEHRLAPEGIWYTSSGGRGGLAPILESLISLTWKILIFLSLSFFPPVILHAICLIYCFECTCSSRMFLFYFRGSLVAKRQK